MTEKKLMIEEKERLIREVNSLKQNRGSQQVKSSHSPQSSSLNPDVRSTWQTYETAFCPSDLEFYEI